MSSSASAAFGHHADIRVNINEPIPGVELKLRIARGESGLPQWMGLVKPPIIADGGKTVVQDKVSPDGSLWHDVYGHTAPEGRFTLYDAYISSDAVENVTIEVRGPDQADTDAAMASLTIYQRPGAPTATNDGDSFVSPAYIKGTKDLTDADVLWRYAPTAWDADPQWQSIANAGGDTVMGDTWWAMPVRLDVVQHLVPNYYITGDYYWAPKTAYLTAADRTVNLEFKSVDYDGNVTKLPDRSLVWKMTVFGEGDHLIQAGESIIVSGPLVPPSLPAEEMHLWTGAPGATPEYGYGWGYSATAPTNFIQTFDAEGHYPIKSAVTAQKVAYYGASAETIVLSDPVQSTIHVIKKRQIQAVSYWYGDSPPTADDVDSWGIIDNDVFYADVLGYTTPVPADARWVLYLNPTYDTYTDWAEYSIGGGERADPAIGSYSECVWPLLWWSKKLDKDGETMIPFYAKYYDDEKDVWLTLEWDVKDQTASATQRGPWTRDTWSYDAVADTYHGHAKSNDPSCTLASLSNMITFAEGYAATLVAVDDNDIPLATQPATINTSLPVGTKVDVGMLLECFEGRWRDNTAAAARSGLKCGFSTRLTRAAGFAGSQYSAAEIDEAFTVGTHASMGCEIGSRWIRMKGLIDTISATNYNAYLDEICGGNSPPFPEERSRPALPLPYGVLTVGYSGKLILVDGYDITPMKDGERAPLENIPHYVILAGYNNRDAVWHEEWVTKIDSDQYVGHGREGPQSYGKWRAILLNAYVVEWQLLSRRLHVQAPQPPFPYWVPGVGAKFQFADVAKMCMRLFDKRNE